MDERGRWMGFTSPRRGRGAVTTGVIVLALFLSGPLGALDKDAERVLSAIREETLSKALSAAGVDKILKTLQEDGSWKDVNYADRTRSGFDPTKHMDRVRFLAQDGARVGWQTDRGKTMADGVTRALAYWFQVKPKSDNWWHQVIGIPGILGPTLTLCADILPEDLRQTAFDSLVAAGKEQEKWTGANRTWIANNNLAAGLLTGNDDLVRLALNALSEEVCMTTEEGLQPDWSFHQHGPMLQTGNYGNAWLGTQVKQAHQVFGTRWAYGEDKIALMRGYILEHSQWPMWGGYYDLSACGRQLDGPKSAESKARGLAGAAKELAEIDTSHSNELTAVWARNQAKDNATGPRGARYFWRSEYMVQRTPEWHASLKLMSARIMRIETTVNDENKIGLFLCDGVTQFRVKGDEQENLQVLWDWRRLPGITGRDVPEPVPPKSKDETKNGGNAFVGGVARGLSSVVAFDFKRDPVTARKGYFYRPWGMVALGAAIESGDGTALFTGVNQMFKRGDLVGWKDARASVPAELMGEARAVWHDGLGYLFAPGQDLNLKIQEVTGKWTDLRTTGSKDTPSGTVVRMHLAHESGKTGCYEYAVIPSPTALHFESRVKSPGYQVLANGDDLQAVSDGADGSVSAIFYKRGKLSAGGIPLSADEACVVLVEKEGEGLAVSVSDPTHALAKLTLKVAGTWKGKGVKPGPSESTLTVDLPKEGMAGSTVTVALSH